MLGVNGKLKIEGIGVGSGAFLSKNARGFVVALQSDLKKYAVYFVSTLGVGSGNVNFLVVDKISGQLTCIYNSQGTFTVNNADEGKSFTEYYIPIQTY